MMIYVASSWRKAVRHEAWIQMYCAWQRWQMFQTAKAGGCKKRLEMCRQKQMRQIL